MDDDTGSLLLAADRVGQEIGRLVRVLTHLKRHQATTSRPPTSSRTSPRRARSASAPSRRPSGPTRPP